MHLFVYPEREIDCSLMEIPSGSNNKILINITDNKPINYTCTLHCEAFRYEENIEVHITNSSSEIIQCDMTTRNSVVTTLNISRVCTDIYGFPNIRTYIRPAEKYIMKINKKGLITSRQVQR